MLVKCEYCHQRVRQRMIKVHEKTCPKARRLKKLENNKLNTQSIEYRNEILSQFNYTQEYDLKGMTDIQFNDLVDRLSALKKQREEKENLLLEKKKEKEEKLEAEKLGQIEKEEKLKEKQQLEEKAQAEQLEREKESLEKDKIKKQKLKKSFEKEVEPVKTEEEKIEEEIKVLNELEKKSLPKTVRKKATRKKK